MRLSPANRGRDVSLLFAFSRDFVPAIRMGLRLALLSEGVWGEEKMEASPGAGLELAPKALMPDLALALRMLGRGFDPIPLGAFG